VTIDRKAELVKELYTHKGFQKLILEDFIDNGIHNLVMTENVDSEAIRDELKARRILYDYLYDIIQEAEIAKTEEKE
jgi:hypothetical protein